MEAHWYGLVLTLALTFSILPEDLEPVSGTIMST
jgi:hypothetical protein